MGKSENLLQRYGCPAVIDSYELLASTVRQTYFADEDIAPVHRHHVKKSLAHYPILTLASISIEATGRFCAGTHIHA